MAVALLHLPAAHAIVELRRRRRRVGLGSGVGVLWHGRLVATGGGGNYSGIIMSKHPQLYNLQLAHYPVRRGVEFFLT